MKIVKSSLALTLVLLMFSCNGASSESKDSNTIQATKIQSAYGSQPISTVNHLNLDEVVLIDVRTPEEFNAGHIEKALNINFFDENFTDQIKDLNTDKTLYLYCRSGKRSLNATKALNQLGYKVVNLEGGFNAYSASK